MSERRKDSKNRVLKDGEYERPNGTYEYRWRDKSGKRRAVYAKTLDELRDKEIDVIKDIMSGKRIVDKDMTVNDLFYRWEKLKKGLRDSTFQSYRWFYNQFVLKGFGETKLCFLKKSDVRAFYVGLHDEKRLKVNTIDSVHTVLHQVLQLGVDDEYLQNNPSDNALKELKRAYNMETEKRQALTMSQQKIFEDYLKEPVCERWRPTFMIMLYTGMRVGELTGLQWSDIGDEFISVNKTLVYYPQQREGIYKECKFAMNTTKTPAGFREIPMLPIVKEMISEERASQERIGLHCTKEVDGYNDFIFVNRFGHLQHQGTLNKALKRIIRDCNYIQMDKSEETLPPFSCHNLRHTFATRLCEANVNLKAIQDILGHADVSTTLDIYTDATRDLKRKGAVTLEEYFKGLGED